MPQLEATSSFLLQDKSHPSLLCWYSSAIVNNNKTLLISLVISHVTVAKTQRNMPFTLFMALPKITQVKMPVYRLFYLFPFFIVFLNRMTLITICSVIIISNKQNSLHVQSRRVENMSTTRVILMQQTRSMTQSLLNLMETAPSTEVGFGLEPR